MLQLDLVTVTAVNCQMCDVSLLLRCLEVALQYGTVPMIRKFGVSINHASHKFRGPRSLSPKRDSIRAKSPKPETLQTANPP